MLAFKFQLTPAQVDLLLVLYSGRYRGADNLYLPDFESSWFVPISRKLGAMGLITHDITRTPTYQITDKGIAVAAMIVDDAKRIASIRRGEFKGELKVKKRLES